MKYYKYHVVYGYENGQGSIEIDSTCKIDNYETITNVENIIKQKNNLDKVVLWNWIQLRTANVSSKTLRSFICVLMLCLQMPGIIAGKQLSIITGFICGICAVLILLED